MTWPRLYRVTLRGIRDERKQYTVLSWLGAPKAVAMAIEVHYGPEIRFWRRRKAWTVYDVEVEDLGDAPRQSDGVVGQGPPGYLEDRAEF
jgi:hypothetical protein